MTVAPNREIDVPRVSSKCIDLVEAKKKKKEQKNQVIDGNDDSLASLGNNRVRRQNVECKVARLRAWKSRGMGPMVVVVVVVAERWLPVSTDGS